MLAQSSDWTFIMRTGTTVPYATRRFNQHTSVHPALRRSARPAKVNERWLADVESQGQHLPARSTTISTPADSHGRGRPSSRFCSSLRSAPPSPRRRLGRRRGRVAQGAARAGASTCGWSCRSTPGCPGTSSSALDGVLSVPMWWGTARGARAHGPAARSDVPIYCLEYNRYFDRPYLYGPPDEGYADNLERFTYLSRGALELCKRSASSPTSSMPTTGRPRWSRSTSTPSSGCSRCTGRRPIYTIHNLAYQGVIDGGAPLHHRPGARALQPGRVRALRRAQPHQGGAAPQQRPVHREPHLRTGNPDRRVRLRPRRRARARRATWSAS